MIASKSMSDISMTVFTGKQSIVDESEAYKRGLAKIGDHQSSEIMDLLEKDSNDDSTSSSKKNENFEIKNLDGIKNAYYKTSAVFSRLSLALNTDEMTRIIT